MRRETYPWASKAKSRAKQGVNALLAELAKDLWPKGTKISERWALVLDAPSMSSSKALRGAGFLKERIVVPNDSDAAFPSERQAVLLRLSLRDFLKQNAANKDYGPFSCVYCDFTQCLQGSWRTTQELEDLSRPASAPAEESPFEDLRSLFGHLAHGDVLLAVTLAHLRSERHRDQWQRLRLLLGFLALQRQRCAVPLRRVELRGVATEVFVLPQSPRGMEVLRQELEAE